MIKEKEYKYFSFSHNTNALDSVVHVLYEDIVYCQNPLTNILGLDYG